MVLAKRFQYYDYGKEENCQKYGQPGPPEYKLSNIRDVPIALFCGSTDMLASTQDYRDLRDNLHQTNSCVFYKEYGYGHLGFLIPPDKILFYELLELISRFNEDYVQ
jgi:homoserine acetyltransferase